MKLLQNNNCIKVNSLKSFNPHDKIKDIGTVVTKIKLFPVPLDLHRSTKHNEPLLEIWYLIPEG